MGIREWFRRTASPSRPEPVPADDHQRLTAWMSAMESGDLCIPRDVHDVDMWNAYWRKQLEVGPIEQGFNDMMSSDPTLIPLLHGRAVKTILCAGIGLSSEALALAMHGFDVTALDVSEVPRAVFQALLQDATGPIGRLPGLTVTEATVVFSNDHAIIPDACPPIHRCDGHSPRGGGSLSYSIGDLTDPNVCPGPFDAVIERRTVQLFPAAEQRTALDRLAARLAPRALLISHQHSGGWKPGESRRHYASDWLEGSGFVVEGATMPADGPRVARLRFTTG